MSDDRGEQIVGDRGRLRVEAPLILDRVASLRQELTDFLRRLVLAESPSDVPEAQAEVQSLVSGALQDLGYRVRRIPGRGTGGHLLARPRERAGHRPCQLLLGHCDTVWPLGTLAEMPCRVDDGRLWGPGSFDMKGGLAQIVFALRALRELGLEPPATPVVLVNSDEEVGSPDSHRHVERLARVACRALVVEPSLGPTGRIKTARKGVGNFTVTLTGKAAHAGLDPASGASAVLALSWVIQELHGLGSPGFETTVNVGIVAGGTRPNVVPASARAEVDVRVPTAEEGRRITEAIRGLASRVPGVTLSVGGGMRIPPMERTDRSRRLWETVRSVGLAMGLELDQASAGGASDGNTTSRFTATVDGLGPVGDGAHAAHEHVELDGLVERCALLAGLLLAPVEDGP